MDKKIKNTLIAVAAIVSNIGLVSNAARLLNIKSDIHFYAGLFILSVLEDYSMLEAPSGGHL